MSVRGDDGNGVMWVTRRQGGDGECGGDDGGKTVSDKETGR